MVPETYFKEVELQVNETIYILAYSFFGTCTKKKKDPNILF